MLLERRRQLPVTPTRGHGVVLLLIWVFSFVAVNVPFINWYGDNWWWKLSRSVAVTLFVFSVPISNREG